MKKKLALVLAGIMTMTMLPMNLFAASENTVTRLSVTGVPEDTAFYASTVPAGRLGTNMLSGDMSYRVQGGYLEIEPKQAVNANETLSLRLINAEWFFRSNLTDNATPVASDLFNLGSATIPSNSVFHSKDVRGWGDAKNIISTEATFDTTVGSWYYAGDASSTAGEVPNADSINTLQGHEGVYHAFGTSNVTAPGVGGAPTDSSVGEAVAPFYLYVSALDATKATVKFPKNLAVGERIYIPLAVTTTAEDADIKVEVSGSTGSTISNNTYIFGYGVGGATTASAKDITTKRDDISLYPVIIEETRPSSLDAGTFELHAPDGYTFYHNSNGTLPGVTVQVQNSTMASNAVAVLKPVTGGSVGFDDQIVVVSLNGYAKTDTLRSAVYISGLKLIPDDDDIFGVINLSVRDVAQDSYVVKEAHDDMGATIIRANSAGVTEMSFKVADRVDYGMKLAAKDATVPQLIAGRHEVNDKSKALRVTWQENAINSWWGPRSTTFSLPDGVKFQQVDVVTTDNTNISGGEYYPGTNMHQNGTAGTAIGSKHATGAVNWATVKIDGKDLKFENVAIINAKKAKVEFDVWLSVRADYEGDITLTPSGNYEYDNSPIVLAKAITPISIETKVSDIKIGYQYQPTQDITIKENIAGALIKSKDVMVSISDMIGRTDIDFSQNSKVAVTNGNIKLTNVTVSSNGSYMSGIGESTGYIRFTIDRASTTASEISITNAAVKVDRDVPETNELPYKVFVYGGAVAQNYGKASDTTNANNYVGLKTGQGAFVGFDTITDTINSAGVAAPYLKVISSANDKTSVLSQPVRVTIGANTYTVGDKEVDMAAAAYISTKSNSTMVPLRFVANAFGLTDDQVAWSQSAKTATLIRPNTGTVQFTADSDKMLINGANVEMVTNGQKVFAEFNTQGDGRMYVPFRALGTAFGIDVSWDAETSTAIYNPSTK